MQSKLYISNFITILIYDKNMDMVGVGAGSYTKFIFLFFLIFWFSFLEISKRGVVTVAKQGECRGIGWSRGGVGGVS